MKACPATTSLVFAYDREVSRENLAYSRPIRRTPWTPGTTSGGGKEIDIILKGYGGRGKSGTLPVEVKADVGERDLEKFSALVDYVGAQSGIMISRSQSLKRGNLEVIPAYRAEGIRGQLTDGGQVGRWLVNRPAGCAAVIRDLAELHCG